MAILKQQIEDFLRLQGHLPEKFLLTEVLGRSEEEADTILSWRHQEIMEMHPAIMEIKLVAERARLRKKFGLPEVENEEMSLNPESIKVRQVKGHLVMDENGQPTLTGAEELPQSLREMFKQQLMREFEAETGHTGIARFSGPNGPGEVEFPNGEVRQYANMMELIQDIQNGNVPGLSPQEEEDEDGED